MNKQTIIYGKNVVPGLLLSVLAWLLAIQTAGAQRWSFNSSPFDNYMTINAYVVLDGAEVENDRFEVAAFIDGECRGACTLAAQSWMGHSYPCFLPVWGEALETGKTVVIKIYNHSTQTEYEAYQKPLYVYNGNLGGFDDEYQTAPLYRLSIGILTGIDNIAGAKTLKACVQNGQLHVSGLTAGKQWSVYSISGATVHQSTAGSGEADIRLAVCGVYIVKSGDAVVKVAY